jgi:hypothetical protein
MSPLRCLLAALACSALAAPAAAAVGRGSCEWRAPANDPYVGDVPGAVDRYTDIPAATRARLKARMEQTAYDDIVTIRRDAIEGNHRYEPVLLDMHFGKGRLCGQVTRKSWKADHEERGLAYCEDGHCIVVPLICRNVSRIIRQPRTATLQSGPGVQAQPLIFDPPAAGLPAAPPAEAEPGADPLALPPPVNTTVPVIPPAQPPAQGLPPAPGEPAGPPVWPAPAMPPLPPAAPPVPEPATAWLWAAGLAAWAICRRWYGLRPRQPAAGER